MVSFKDKHGRDWDLDLGFRELNRVRARTGLVLIDLTEDDRKAGPLETDPKTGKASPTGRAAQDLETIRADHEAFLAVTYALVEPDALARGMDLAAFVTSFDLESLCEAIDAVNEELVVFSLPRTEKARGRELLRKRTQLLKDRLQVGTAVADLMTEIAKEPPAT